MQLLKGGGLSSKYRIFETNEFLKQLKKLDPPVRVFIQNKLLNYVYPQIKAEPCSGKNIKKLRGYLPDAWRYRIGRFRIFYTVDTSEEIIYLLTLDDRKGAYK
jgi:mRNA interferase RelE/StbE